MTSRSKKRLFNLARLAICVLALWVVIRGVTFTDEVTLADGRVVAGEVIDAGDPVRLRLADGSEREWPRREIGVDEHGEPTIALGLKTSLRNSDWLLLLLAVLIHFPVGFLQAFRLKALLRVQSIDLSLWNCIKLSFAGNFLNFATPLGSNAGDVFKAYFVTTHTKHKTEAATTIAFDRAIGLGTLILCVALISSISSAQRLAAFQPYILTFLGLGLVTLIVYFSPFLRRLINAERFLSKLKFYDHLQRIDRAARTLMGRLPTLVFALFVTVLLQVMAIGAYFTVAIAIGLTARAENVLEYYAYFYTGAVIQALPGPPQGLGTVELAYRYFFAPFGSVSQILCMALLARMVVLTCALPGLFVALTGSYLPSRKSIALAATDSHTSETEHDLAAS